MEKAGWPVHNAVNHLLRNQAMISSPTYVLSHFSIVVTSADSIITTAAQQLTSSWII